MELKREQAPNWVDYELFDSGDFEKCERFGDVIFIRPEPQALWKKASQAHWGDAHAIYSRTGKEGEWQFLQPTPNHWKMKWEDLTFQIRPTSFKHTGLFPEQAGNWRYLRQHLTPGKRVLNLFGYTGGATLAALSAGAEVTHVDASKPAVTWAKENAELSKLDDRPVRWIVDDAKKFVAREIKRGNQYDAIIMDPPAFGRGPEGELWKFEEDVPALLEDCAKLLSTGHGLLIVNAYSLGFPAIAVEQAIKTAFPAASIHEVVELTMKESTVRGFELPGGVAIRCRW